MPDNDGEPEFVGGHVLLDFVNTIAWRLDSGRTVDRIPDCAALLRWAAAAELIDVRQWEALRQELDVDPAAGRSVAAKAQGLREAMYRLLEPVATGRAPSRSDVTVVRRMIIDALTRGEIVTVVPLRWTVPLHTLRDLPLLLSMAAWQLLQLEDLTRLRQCQDSGCGWLFLDRSKNASRRWCSSADCGNRTRARRHYQRRREASPALKETSDQCEQRAHE